jgi:hypothetical protein
MGEIQDQGQDQRDAAIWAEWVSGTNQTEIGRRRGISQSAVSQAIHRFLADQVPAQDRPQSRPAQPGRSTASRRRSRS